MKTCFIIMPITTPDHLVETYGRRIDHFRLVLEHIFVVAVEEAGQRLTVPDP